MPYIRVSATQKLTPEKQEELVNGLGEALSTIPGKDARGLIVDLEDGKTMFVGGARQETSSLPMSGISPISSTTSKRSSRKPSSTFSAEFWGQRPTKHF